MVLGEIFGPDLLIVIIVIAIVIFGGAAIPKMARSLGSAKTEFEKGLKSGGENAASEVTDADKPVTPPTTPPAP